MSTTLHNEDCMIGMAQLPAASIDLIACDLPYGTTQNKWDSIIDLPSMWTQYERILKPSGTVVLTAAQPFTTVLGASNLPWLRYEWIWQKSNVSNYLNAHHQPMRQHETVLVFSPKPKGTYNPQGLIPLQRTIKQSLNTTTNYGKHGGEIHQEWTNFPTTLLDIESRTSKTHPTEKPVELMEYLVKTHSNPGETVLDNCMGSGTTGIACINSGRHFIGYELDPAYFAMAQDRIENHVYRRTDRLSGLWEDEDVA